MCVSVPEAGIPMQNKLIPFTSNSITSKKLVLAALFKNKIEHQLSSTYQVGQPY